MKNINEREVNRDFYQAAITVILSMLAAYFVIWAFTGNGFFSRVTYNSYLLQAERWLSGHLDLGAYYGHLEIAEYGGKYFISFPPIPSVILLPFVLLFGVGFRAHIIAVILSIIGALYALKLAFNSGLCKTRATVFTLLLTIGSNFLHIGYTADVWYMAQVSAFAFTMMSIYYGAYGGEKKGWLALFCLALAVGCRPFNMIYLPLVAWLVISDCGIKHILKKYYLWILPPLAVGIFMMILNALRFGNPFEFGHNYLPEFAKESVNGQFHISYIAENLKNMFRLPEYMDRKLVFPKFNGVALWLVSPIFLVWAGLGVKKLIKGYKDPVVWLCILLPVIHLICLCAHKTLGGWQFGNRYTVDLLPCIFYGIMYFEAKGKDIMTWIYPLLFWGMGVNLVGTIATVMSWV